jgi:DNA polymerase III subunit gamma/tau
VTEPFDLEYRPKRFSDVLGNAGVVKLLLKRSSTGTLAGRSMMFGGPKGSGKTSLARIVARAVVCDSLADGEPCNKCAGCLSIADGSADSVDEFDAATQGTVDRMRSIVEDLEYGTVSGKPRVIVLDEAHRLSKQSQDALLKSMEDRRIVVILCTTEPHSIKTAIRSRVEEYPVAYPPEQELLARLGFVCSQHKIDCELDALEMIVSLNARCPRTSLTTLQSAALVGPVTVATVREITRFSSMESVVRALTVLHSDPRAASVEFDGLFDQEGPTWVRDQVVLAISSAMRAAFGAKPTHPVPPSFWPARGDGWLATAHSLSLLERPNQADIEAVLYSGVISVPASGAGSVPVRPQEPAPPLPPPVKAPVKAGEAVAVPPAPPQSAARPPAPPKVIPEPPPSVKVVLSPETARPRVLEVDGVRFSSDEVLTSLDSKIEHGGAPPGPELGPDIRVEFDSESLPMTEKEFARGFLERIRT